MSESKEVYRPRKHWADRLGVHEDTIDRWTKAGKFPQPVKFGPRSTRWRESDILEWEKTRETA